ncbi:hypothetical protein D9M69_513230 [compost metagenome]
MAPIAQPSGRTTVTCSLSGIQRIAGIGIDVGISQSQAIEAADTPVELGFDPRKARLVGIAGNVLIVAQRLTDHAGDFVVEQLHVERQPRFGKIAVVAQFPGAHVLLIKVAGAAGLDEITGAGLAKRTGLEVGDLITPVDVVFEHVR